MYFYPRPPRGGRLENVIRHVKLMDISIHALREEGDVGIAMLLPKLTLFLSTPSARRATYCPENCRWATIFLSTPSARRATDLLLLDVSIGQFLSTPSARRATSYYYPQLANIGISIHALREEGDDTFKVNQKAIVHFYPRPPRGGRLSSASSASTVTRFLSTPSARRATRQYFLAVEAQ